MSTTKDGAMSLTAAELAENPDYEKLQPLSEEYGIPSSTLRRWGKQDQYPVEMVQDENGVYWIKVSTLEEHANKRKPGVVLAVPETVLEELKEARDNERDAHGEKRAAEKEAEFLRERVRELQREIADLRQQNPVPTIPLFRQNALNPAPMIIDIDEEEKKDPIAIVEEKPAKRGFWRRHRKVSQ